MLDRKTNIYDRQALLRHRSKYTPISTVHTKIRDKSTTRVHTSNILACTRTLPVRTRRIRVCIRTFLVRIRMLIKIITKFSNVIGYQQPDLNINWTVAHVMLVIGQYAPLCVLLRALC